MQTGETRPERMRDDGWCMQRRSLRLIRIAMIMLPVLVFAGWLLLRLNAIPAVRAIHHFEFQEQGGTGIAYCQSFGSSAVVMANYPDSLFIYDPTKADIAARQVDIDFESSIPVSVSPNGFVCFAGYDLLALDSAGNELWSFSGSSRGFRAVVATAERVYATGHENELYALDNTGKLLWKFDQGWETDGGGCTGWDQIPLAVGSDGSAVYETRSWMGGSAPRIVAVDPDGQLAWRVEYGANYGPTLMSSGLVGDYALTLYRDSSNIWSLTARNWQGEKLWVVPTDFIYSFRDVVQLEDGFVSRCDTGITRMNDDGTVRWNIPDTEYRLGIPAALPDGRLIALERVASPLSRSLDASVPVLGNPGSSLLSSFMSQAESFNLVAIGSDGVVSRRLRLNLKRPSTPLYCRSMDQLVLADTQRMLVLRASDV